MLVLGAGSCGAVLRRGKKESLIRHGCVGLDTVVWSCFQSRHTGGLIKILAREVLLKIEPHSKRRA